MAKISKKRKEALSKYDQAKAYDIASAAKILKTISNNKFDASVEMSVRLGIDVKQANQMVRGTVSLPRGTGKTLRVLVLCTPDEIAGFGTRYQCIRAVQGGLPVWVGRNTRERRP